MKRRKFLGLSVLTTLALFSPGLYASVSDKLYEGHIFSNDLQVEFTKTSALNSKRSNQYVNSKVRDSIKKARIYSSNTFRFSRSVANESSNISIDKDKANDSPTIVNIFLYGGASELAGNITNLEIINEESLNPYPLRSITATSDNFWQEAGGLFLQSKVNSGDATVFRTCKRSVMLTKSHGECVSSNLRGTNIISAPGIASNISYLYTANGITLMNSVLPFVTMEGESIIYDKADLVIPPFALPSPIGSSLENPYGIVKLRDVTVEQYDQLEDLALSVSLDDEIKESFVQAGNLSAFVEEIQNQSATLPDGITYVY